MPAKIRAREGRERSTGGGRPTIWDMQSEDLPDAHTILHLDGASCKYSGIALRVGAPACGGEGCQAAAAAAAHAPAQAWPVHQTASKTNGCMSSY
eukprot:1159837-Pelagomonas_calceolata.AAC.3